MYKNIRCKFLGLEEVGQDDDTYIVIETERGKILKLYSSRSVNCVQSCIKSAYQRWGNDESLATLYDMDATIRFVKCFNGNKEVEIWRRDIETVYLFDASDFDYIVR